MSTRVRLYSSIISVYFIFVSQMTAHLVQNGQHIFRAVHLVPYPTTVTVPPDTAYLVLLVTPPSQLGVLTCTNV